MQNAPSFHTHTPRITDDVIYVANCAALLFLQYDFIRRRSCGNLQKSLPNTLHSLTRVTKLTKSRTVENEIEEVGKEYSPKQWHIVVYRLRSKWWLNAQPAQMQKKTEKTNEKKNPNGSNLYKLKIITPVSCRLRVSVYVRVSVCRVRCTQCHGPFVIVFWWWWWMV